MGQPQWPRLVSALRAGLDPDSLPSVSQIARSHRTPFHVLVSTMISLRTRDEVTFAASDRLFRLADTPAAMLELDESQIADAIYPSGFYRTKARNILEASRIIRDEHDGAVPDSVDGLTALPGVGRKTANLVLGLGFGIPAICVDTHVHRIANRCGWIATKTPEATEYALMEILPKPYWIEINELLVHFGQQVCTPTSPRCSSCPISDQCERIGVTRSR
ncbi:MAG: endonuclease III domain-containing protein [Spirochaetota bacterium]